jgi:pilus assembly protein CpaD
VTAALIRKDSTMRSKLLLIALGSALAGCNTPASPDQGLASVNVPVVTSADYVFDATAPGGALAPGESERLSGWLAGLGLGYGDTIYVDGAYADTARAQVAALAGHYGMAISPGAPVTSGMVQPDTVRVVVSRRRATVPNCPNWSLPSEPNFGNRNMPNFGCGVNSDLAMQVANPEDLVHGQEGSAIGDTRTGSKAVLYYRSLPPSGAKGLEATTTSKGNQ